MALFALRELHHFFATSLHLSYHASSDDDSRIDSEFTRATDLSPSAECRFGHAECHGPLADLRPCESCIAVRQRMGPAGVVGR